MLLGGTDRRQRLSGLLLTLLDVWACLRVALRHDALADQHGHLDGGFRAFVASTLPLVTLEAARRAIGWPLPLVALAALGHALFIAAGMVGAPWPRVAGHAMALGVGLYLIPPAMIVSPALLAPLDRPVEAGLALARAGVGSWVVSRAAIGPGVRWWRVVLAAGGGMILLGQP